MELLMSVSGLVSTPITLTVKRNHVPAKDAEHKIPEALRPLAPVRVRSMTTVPEEGVTHISLVVDGIIGSDFKDKATHLLARAFVAT